MGVYVMTTLRFFFHMGSVECVTCHGPLSQESVGGEMEGEDWVVGREDGARRVTIVERVRGGVEWYEG
jgi:mono/diheme cytochrome c family protein